MAALMEFAGIWLADASVGANAAGRREALTSRTDVRRYPSPVIRSLISTWLLRVLAIIMAVLPPLVTMSPVHGAHHGAGDCDTHVLFAGLVSVVAALPVPLAPPETPTDPGIPSGGECPHQCHHHGDEVSTPGAMMLAMEVGVVRRALGPTTHMPDGPVFPPDPPPVRTG